MNTKFCVLAVRPLKDCHENFRKNLTEDLLYQFYGGYKFLNGKKEVMGTGSEVTSIVVDDSKIVPSSLYYFKDKKFHFDLNISAVVGPNGSGKSSILELFYASCFYQETFLDLNDHATNATLTPLVGNIFQQLKVEIYFIEEVDKKRFFKRLKIIDGTCKIQKLNLGKWRVEPNKKLPFYSVAVNYSLYGLNSTLKEDEWLESLFHKNDGYQTPLVINPFRQNGNININSEFHLAQSRLITNIGINITEKYRLNEGIYAYELLFKIDPSKVYDIEDWSLTALIKTFEDQSGQSIIDYLQELSQALIKNVTFNLNEFDFLEFLVEDSYFDNERTSNPDNPPRQIKNHKNYRFYFLIKYVIKKIYRICFNYYKQYGNDYLDFTIDEKIPYLKTDEASKVSFFKKLGKDNSHITTKLKQALYAMKNDFQDELLWQIIDHPERDGEKLIISHSISVKEFGQIVQSFKNKNKHIIDEHLVPASFFIPQILVGKKKASSFYDFKKMSSGEQQMVHSIQSIIYHILNINSVHKSGDKNRARYNYVNIILDEIELYYHPQYQKKFVYEFIKSLKIITDNIDKIKGINVLFSTHSPFILSDIPNWNVMKLSDGKPSISLDKTFAANIHDLLANDFFLENGYFGEWAKYKLERITEQDYKKNKPSIDDFRVVDLVGEPILRQSLLEFMLKDRSNGEIDAVIDRLQKLKS